MCACVCVYVCVCVVVMWPSGRFSFIFSQVFLLGCAPQSSPRVCARVKSVAQRSPYQLSRDRARLIAFRQNRRKCTAVTYSRALLLGFRQAVLSACAKPGTQIIAEVCAASTLDLCSLKPTHLDILSKIADLPLQHTDVLENILAACIGEHASSKDGRLRDIFPLPSFQDLPVDFDTGNLPRSLLIGLANNAILGLNLLSLVCAPRHPNVVPCSGYWTSAIASMAD